MSSQLTKHGDYSNFPMSDVATLQRGNRGAGSALPQEDLSKLESGYNKTKFCFL